MLMMMHGGLLGLHSLTAPSHLRHALRARRSGRARSVSPTRHIRRDAWPSYLSGVPRMYCVHGRSLGTLVRWWVGGWPVQGCDPTIHEGWGVWIQDRGR
ncbi:uncharacterized protein BP01DRAFT_359077 [Aspergillus saccharolyticus JOP 1030-1]|uniref:Uncharacterized protein n=1 Tax=Aspergillus saccharolyticus JOP 1030-1 TaxID=1450539 RepID=A0A318ZDU6_9EURO|nr:hypothetical protein BP01DRAFT_359077 [Aspergillus saccharolyticus JOP 1030-1]PYH42843.1 hypothetical protein BP01DRAFT_359077 [Aspergillus saccharolyticus JOP 1030-1]